MRKVVTIGGYGHTETSFLDALRASEVSVFVDVRQRRGMRGAKYAFLNSNRLQLSLQQAGIRYLHVKELAPTSVIRTVQHQADKHLGDTKLNRTHLSDSFIEAFHDEILSKFDMARFSALIGTDTEVIAFFCVESSPDACHRSLVALSFAESHGLRLEHIHRECTDSRPNQNGR